MFGNKPLSATDDVIGDDVALNAPIDVAGDVDVPEEVLVIIFCVLGVGEGIVYMVAVLNVIVASTVTGGGGGGGGICGGGGGGGSCPLRTALKGGGTASTVAHSFVNQAEVDWKSSVEQLWAIQGTASTKNPRPGVQMQVHYSSAPNKSHMVLPEQ